MRIFYAALIIVVAVILFILPISEATYDFRTDNREDTFAITTGIGVTTANVTLIKSIYEDDTATLSFSSNITETPTFSSWNGTNRSLGIAALTANATRSLTVGYDVAVFRSGSAVNSLLDNTPLIWYLMIICLPGAAIISIFWGRN